MQPTPHPKQIATKEKSRTSSSSQTGAQGSSRESHARQSDPTYSIKLSSRKAQAVASGSAVSLALILSILLQSPGTLTSIFLSAIFCGGFAGLFDLTMSKVTFKHKKTITATGSFAMFLALLYLLLNNYFDKNPDESTFIYEFMKIIT